MQRAALAGRRAVFGDDHPAVADSLSSLGMLLVEQGQAEAAQALLQEALDIQRRHFDASRLALPTLNLGYARHRAGDLAGAEQAYEEAVRLARMQTSNRILVGMTLLWLGRVQADSGRPAEAAPNLREALALHDEVYGATNTWSIEVRILLARAMLAQGHHAEAESLLLAVEPEPELAEAEHKAVMEALIDVYAGWGREDEVRRYRTRLETLSAPAAKDES